MFTNRYLVRYCNADSFGGQFLHNVHFLVVVLLGLNFDNYDTYI